MKTFAYLAAVLLLVALAREVYVRFTPMPATPSVTPEVGVSAYKDVVRVYEPAVDQRVVSPLTIRGEARGQWFFEASFPVVLTDWDGRIITQGVAQAGADWMTADYVPFTAVLTFDVPTVGETGALILRKDNPSGIPEYDDAYEMRVRF